MKSSDCAESVKSSRAPHHKRIVEHAVMLGHAKQPRHEHTADEVACSAEKDDKMMDRVGAWFERT